MRRGVPEAVIGGTTGIAPGSSPRWVATSRSRPRSTAAGARLADPADAAAAELLATVKRAGFGDRELAELAGTRPDAIRARPARARAAAGVRDGRHVRRGVRRRDALLLLDLRGGRVGARGAARRPSRGAGHRVRAGPDRAGDRVRLLRGPGGRHAPPRRLERGDDQLEPGDGVDRLRRLHPALLRAARSRERPERHRRRERRGPGRLGRSEGEDLLPAVVAYGGQTPLNLAAPLAAGGVPLLGASLEAIDQAEERTRFSALLDRLGHPAARGRDGALGRGGADARRADRLPGHRPAVVRHRRPGHRLLLLAGRTSPASWRRRRSSTRTARSGSTATSRAWRSTSTRSRTASGS